jgi:hypothetical protein
MKRLAQMADAELRQFMIFLGGAVGDMIPEDASFVLVVGDDRGKANYASDLDRSEAVRVLRQLADQIERLN